MNRNWLVGVLLGLSTSVFAVDVNDSLTVVKKTNDDSINSQQRVDKLALETQRMLDEYQQILRNTEYQDAYNAQLQNLKSEQDKEIAILKEQLNDINVTQMRIMPLIFSMADALEKFVVLDLPFKQEERINGVVQLKLRLRNPGLSVPDKYRLLLEAFQIENDYGRTLETYRDHLSIDGESVSVEFLRVGRVALYYQTLDGDKSGYWDKQQDKWIYLPASMNGNIKQAMQIARNQRAPELLNLPMNQPE